MSFKASYLGSYRTSIKVKKGRKSIQRLCLLKNSAFTPFRNIESSVQRLFFFNIQGSEEAPSLENIDFVKVYPYYTILYYTILYYTILY